MKNDRIRGLTGIIAGAFLCFALPCFGQDLVDPIVGVANATSCGGGTNCVGGTTAYSLTAIENGTESLPVASPGQQQMVYLVVNDTGSSTFSLLFNGLLASNQFLDCQENGGFHGACTTSGALGTEGNSQQYGPPAGLPNGTYWNPDATFTFTGIGAGDFDITTASFANGDTGSLTGPTAVPEGSGFSMLALSGLVLLGTLAFKKKLPS